MEVNRLLGDEIVYELTIRGLPIQHTVAENRCTLRGALRAEREGMCPTLTFSVEVDNLRELGICSQKLEDLGNDIKNFDVKNFVNEYRRISSRLSHVSQRLGRLPIGTGADEERKALLIGRCLQLVDVVGTLYDHSGARELDQQPTLLDGGTTRDSSILDDPIPLLPDVQQASGYVGPTATSAAETNMRTSSARDRSTAAIVGSSMDGVQDLIDFDMPDHNQRTRADEHRRQRKSEETSRSAVKFLDGDRQPDPVSPLQAIQEDYIGLSTTERVRDIPVRTSQYFLSPRDERLATTNTTQNFRDKLADLRLSPVVYPRTYPSADHSRYLDVSRWGLRYNGETSVTNFLERLEELRLSRGATYDQLLRSAPELFTGQALLWYRTHQFMTWDDLVVKLKEDFQPYDYVNFLWEEIRKRTQGERERIVAYVAAMENLFNKLGSEKPPERTRVNQIRRNLLPYIQTQLSLVTVDTISELTRVGKAVEETALRTQQFCPPSINYKYMLEPELAYHKPSGNVGPHLNALGSEPHGTSQKISSTRVSQQGISRSNTQDTPAVSAIASSPVVCWNCKETGHRFRKCPEPRKVFCFKCGRDNIYTNKCPNCQKNGTRGQ